MITFFLCGKFNYDSQQWNARFFSNQLPLCKLVEFVNCFLGCAYTDFVGICEKIDFVAGDGITFP